jgi:TRAP-type uncharacterized transport system fused permease subunit
MKNGWTREVTVDEAAPRLNLSDQMRSLGRSLLQGSPYLIAFALLIYQLGILRYGPLTAGRDAIFILIPLALLRDLITDGFSGATAVSWLEDTIEGCKAGVTRMAPLTAVIAVLGVIIRVITMTGFSQRISFLLVSFAGEITFFILLIALFTSLLFGLGMPTPAAYILVAIIVAPPLVRQGVAELPAHLFVLYYALLSTITPPVGISVAVGAGIAESDFWDTAFVTMRLGFFAFILPFVFVYNPELVYWNGAQTWITFAGTMVGVVALVLALTGYQMQNLPVYAGRSSVFAYAIRTTFFVFAIALFVMDSIRAPMAVVMLAALAFIIFVDVDTISLPRLS